MKDQRPDFVRDPKICTGETVFRGTRVLLRAVLADRADGASIPQVLGDSSSLTEEQVRAARCIVIVTDNQVRVRRP